MKMTSWAVLLMSVLSSKARLKASHDFNLSFKVSLTLSERSFVLCETEKRERLLCSTKCFFSEHAYSVNIVKQFLIYSLSLKGFPFSAIHSQSLKLSFVTISEFFLFVSGKNTLLFFTGFFQFFQMLNFVHSCLTNNFIKLGGVLSCGVTFNVILFLDCNCILTSEADNTLVVWDNKIFCGPFTVHHTLPSSSIFRFLAADILLALKSTQMLPSRS